ncbi:MAG TPA: hemolysin III family protein [Xanthobacteraceae bacterium]|nr:hemolysin III family protein [Xanthobacteraceae bacterium]
MMTSRPPSQNSYDRAELIADAVIHGIGVSLGLAGAIVLIVIAAGSIPALLLPSIAIYALGLTSMLGLSAAYNMWPDSPVKGMLRRLDHSAIFVMIAATYTPFLWRIPEQVPLMALLIGVWVVAIAGVALKLLLPGRFDRAAIALYLALGWSALLAYDAIAAAIPARSLWLLAAGGVLYSTGVIFHAWQRLRFQNAIWHGFVLLAACCHYAAVLLSLSKAEV